MARRLYRKSDSNRLVASPSKSPALAEEKYRTPWRRDYARVVHCAAFRRLQGKTQLFPNHESDFFRNRLSHSLEVAQVAKSIAIRVNEAIGIIGNQKVITDIVETAALCHDLGHPPFGHTGEAALDKCMEKDGGFEGNAQTLRILARLEKRQTTEMKGNTPIAVNNQGNDCRAGLNLTSRTLASVLKYDNEIPHELGDRKKPGIQKGYYRTEREITKKIKIDVLGGEYGKKKFKTIECYIMDVADDIAYSTYDLEDAFKAEFLSPISMISAPFGVLDKVAKEVKRSIDEYPEELSKEEKDFESEDVISILISLFGDIFNLSDFGVKGDVIVTLDTKARAAVASKAFGTSRALCTNGYFRSEFTSHLVGRFIRGIKVEPDHNYPPLSKVYLDIATLKEVEVLKHFVYQSLILSPMLKVAEYRGKKIVNEIFVALVSEEGKMLLPDDFRALYENLDDSLNRKRVICDFISGMTDKYALEFHGRLFSNTPETIFKPI